MVEEPESRIEGKSLKPFSADQAQMVVKDKELNGQKTSEILGNAHKIAIYNSFAYFGISKQVSFGSDGQQSPIVSVEETFPRSDGGKCFLTNADSGIHEGVRTNNTPFACRFCGKCFITKDKLAKHEKIHTKKLFLCSECGKCFYERNNFKQHIRIHTGEKPFACSECGKCFTQRAHVVYHKAIHTGLKPFSCSECKKCFSRKTALMSHKKIHSERKPFACTKSGKCCYANSALIRSGEKPFSCSTCFAQKCNVFRQQTTHERSCSRAPMQENNFVQNHHSRDRRDLPFKKRFSFFEYGKPLGQN